MKKLTPELTTELLGLIRETDEEDYEIIDMEGLIRFVGLHGTEYPFLFGMLKINEALLVDHFEKTGEVPPGIKMVRTTRKIDGVTELEVLHGPIRK